MSSGRSPRSSHATGGSHSKKPSLSNFASFAGRPSIPSSISDSMRFLSRSSTSVSEPKTHHKASPSIELLSANRSGALGSGATVVKTPDDALKDSGVRLPMFAEDKTVTSPYHYESSPPTGRTLPPLPSELDSEDDGERVGSYEMSSQENLCMPPPARPMRAPPPCPVGSSSSQSQSAAPVSSRPPLCTTHAHVQVPPPPFRILLMSDAPNATVERSKVVVTLETDSATVRTTLDTLLSQPSFLSEYLLSIFPRGRTVSRSSSIYSTGSEGDVDVQETYRNHLLSTGLLSKAPFNIHLFLDRPSDSYPLILSYLRSGAFPRLFTLEALLDLRDEAAFIGLATLYDLCNEEIRQQTGVNEGRAPSVHSMHASVHSLHALIERVGRESQADYVSVSEKDRGRFRPSHHTMGSSDSGGSFNNFKPPTPQSWKNGRSSSTSHPGRSTVSLRSPAGWI